MDRKFLQKTDKLIPYCILFCLHLTQSTNTFKNGTMKNFCENRLMVIKISHYVHPLSFTKSNSRSVVATNKVILSFKLKNPSIILTPTNLLLRGNWTLHFIAY